MLGLFLKKKYLKKDYPINIHLNLGQNRSINECVKKAFIEIF